MTLSNDEMLLYSITTGNTCIHHKYGTGQYPFRLQTILNQSLFVSQFNWPLAFIIIVAIVYHEITFMAVSHKAARVAIVNKFK